MEFVAVMLVSAAVSALVSVLITNTLCRKHLDAVDGMTQSVLDEMKSVGTEIADRARSVIEETHKK